MYLDIYFIVNFVLNSCILECSVRNYRVRRWRIWTAAAAAALGGCLWELLQLSEIWRPFSILILSGGMLQICIGCRPWRQWLKSLFQIYLFGFLMAGVLPVVQRYFSFWILAVALSYGGLQLFLHLQTKNMRRECRLRIRSGEQQWQLKALVDSGHLLREPLQGRPVLIVQEAALPGHPPACFPVMYQTVQGSDLMLGFWPDCIQVDEKLFRGNELLIGVVKDWREKEYQALIPEEVVQ